LPFPDTLQTSIFHHKDIFPEAPCGNEYGPGYPARFAKKSVWGENQTIEKDKKMPGR
jgi:hypothetical protein